MGSVALKRGWAVCGYRGAKGDKSTKVVPALYTTWQNFRRRCRTDSPVYYRWYKAKGITFCPEWRSYATFRAWALANGYRKGLWIDRINGAGNYEPSNCQWVTREAQIHNMSHVIWMTFNGERKPLPVWARERGYTVTTLRSRIKHGWTAEQALTLPTGTYRPGFQRGRKPRAIQPSLC